MQKKTKQQSLSTKKTETGHTAQSLKLSGSDSRSSKYYQSILDLPLYLFIRAQVDNDLTALIIEGEVDPDELESAWYAIHSEYADTIGDQQLRNYLTTYKKYCTYEVTITQAELLLITIKRIILHSIQIGETFHLYQALQEQRRNFVYRLNTLFMSALLFTDETYQQDIIEAQGYITNLDLRFEIEGQKLQQIKNKADEAGGNSKATRESYMQNLITLSDHSKMQINDHITVYEYCIRMKRFEDYVKSFKMRQSWPQKN